MKKLLSLLATVSLASTATASVVACGSGENIKQDISTIVSVTDLGNIGFFSITGNDPQTQTEIIFRIKNLNGGSSFGVDFPQIDISNISRARGSAVISVLGFNESLTVTFTPVTLASISFSSRPTSMIQLQDGTILVTGGINANGSDAFLASADHFVPINLAQGPDAFPSIPRSITQLQDGTILVTGGTAANGSNSFLASVDLSDPDNPQTQTLAQGSTAFPSTLQSMIQLQDGTILVAGGDNLSGANSFLASVDLSDPANPQIQILTQGSTAFSSTLQSMIQLQDGTILVAGGNVANGSDSFLASVDLSNPANPQTQILAQGSAAFPSIPQSMIQLQDGRILVTGGTNAEDSDSFLASVNLSNPANPQTQTLAQGSTAFPSTPWSMIELYDGTILVIGGSSMINAFLASVDLSNPANPQIQILGQGSMDIFPASS